jgi:hypothetical protein
VAESSHARKPVDLGEIYRAPSTSSVAAASDPPCLDVPGESGLRNPLREICTVGSVREEIPGGAMLDLNGHEAGNGGHSQGKPTAYRDSSTQILRQQCRTTDTLLWLLARSATSPGNCGPKIDAACEVRLNLTALSGQASGVVSSLSESECLRPYGPNRPPVAGFRTACGKLLTGFLLLCPGCCFV